VSAFSSLTVRIDPRLAADGGAQHPSNSQSSGAFLLCSVLRYGRYGVSLEMALLEAYNGEEEKAFDF
jgi:hypothetical protein